MVIGAHVLRRLQFDALKFECLYLRVNGSHDAARNVVLQLKNIRQVAVESIRPKMPAGRCVDKLTRYSNLLPGFPNAAFEDIPNAQLATYMPHINGLPLVRKARISRDYK